MIDLDDMPAHDAVLVGLLEASHNYGEMTPRFVDALYHIAQIAIEDKYPNHPRKDDMVAEAMLVFCRTWYRFDLSKSQKPLSYFYVGAYSAGLCWLNKENKEYSIREQIVDSQ